MNRYKLVRPIQPVQEDPSRTKPSPVDGGYRGDLAPHLIPADSSPSVDHIRFEQGAIRKDFGARRVGTPATSRVIGLGEHKFITDGQTFERLIRLIRTGESKLELQVLTAGEWQVIDTSVEDVADVYLSTASIQGIFLIADGDNLFRWGESIETDIREDDFPAGNSISAVDQEITAIVGGTPANGHLRVAFSTTISGTSLDGITLKVGIERNGVEIDEKTFVLPASEAPDASDSWNEQQSSYSVPGLEEDDEIKIKIKSIEADNPTRPFEIDGVGDTVVKVDASEAFDDTYTFEFHLAVDGSEDGEAGVRCRIHYTIGAGPLLDSGEFQDFFASTGPIEYDVVFPIVLDGAVADTEFQVVTEFLNATVVLSTISALKLIYEATPIAPVVVEVHGLNKAVDADTFAGIETEVAVDNVSTLAVIGGAPSARMIFPFEDYAVALRDGGDTQTFSWPVSGDMLDWVGVGSGQLFLVAAQSDPIDDLMSFSTLGSGVGALFRRRSIMRVFLTGNPLQSLGVVRWIERLGTDAGFSVQAVVGGVMFLGSDFQVYLLTEQGPTAVGTPIHQDLIRTLTGNLDLIDSSYDEGFHTYVLGVPENGATKITRLWYFDVMAYHTKQKMVWRSRAIEVQRLATASKL